MNREDVLPENAAGQAPAAGAADRGAADARRKADRRRFTWRTIVYSVFRPRRRRPNRAADQKVHYVDYHPTSTLWWCLGIMILAAVDAAMMLYVHDLGFQQQNGFVATLIDSGRGVYLAVKMLGTGAALMMLAAASSLVVYRFLPARYLFPIVFFGYLVYVLNLLRYFL